ncbi:hypothetical protein [Microbispora amethystogenes]|uniref:hypothetical protein n=1 Tax=Microbispora amethystogenes TaxID=1427754 RepID=UPI0019534B87|nr:hypothetical protein [Microbispora amethystogenes]
MDRTRAVAAALSRERRRPPFASPGDEYAARESGPCRREEGGHDGGTDMEGRDEHGGVMRRRMPLAHERGRQAGGRAVEAAERVRQLAAPRPGGPGDRDGADRARPAGRPGRSRSVSAVSRRCGAWSRTTTG